jgi:uncharacterized membrane protein
MKLADVFRIAKTYKMSDAQRFAQHVVPEVVRPARVIWNQAIGGIFLLFALLFLGYAFDYYRHMNAEPKNGLGFGFSLFLGLVMAFFSLSSFLKARKIARPRTSGRT